MNKKSQIQMGETVAVVIIVMILMIAGLVFWSKMTREDVKNTARDTDELFVIEISNIVSEMPELKCSRASTQQPNCFDLYKIRALAQALNASGNTRYEYYRRYYVDVFRTSKITFQQIYPATNQWNITVYDYGMSNVSRKHLVTIPVTIQDDLNQRTNFGVIYVEGYTR